MEPAPKTRVGGLRTCFCPIACPARRSRIPRPPASPNGCRAIERARFLLLETSAHITFTSVGPTFEPPKVGRRRRIECPLAPTSSTSNRYRLELEISRSRRSTGRTRSRVPSERVQPQTFLIIPFRTSGNAALVICQKQRRSIGIRYEVRPIRSHRSNNERDDNGWTSVLLIVHRMRVREQDDRGECATHPPFFLNLRSSFKFSIIHGDFSGILRR